MASAMESAMASGDASAKESAMARPMAWATEIELPYPLPLTPLPALVAAESHLSVRTANDNYDGLALIREVLEGNGEVGKRHQRIRSGPRAQLPHHVRSAVWFRDNGRCEICADGKHATPWEADHIIPWSAGGSDDTTNLRVLCQEHNQERSNFVTAVDNRPRMAATWWCDRCYGLDSGEWTYFTDRMPACPIHKTSPKRCRVWRNYDWAFRNPDVEWTSWHKRQTVLEPTLTAYCAHCDMPGVTDVVL